MVMFIDVDIPDGICMPCRGIIETEIHLRVVRVAFILSAILNNELEFLPALLMI